LEVAGACEWGVVVGDEVSADGVTGGKADVRGRAEIVI
jgi:hypothetical protein